MADSTHPCCDPSGGDVRSIDPAAITSARVREALQAIESAGALVNWREWSAQENNARVHLLRLYGEHGRAPTIGELTERLNADASEVRMLLASLRARDAVVLDPLSGEVVGAYPFTDAATEHQVRLGAVTLRAMCAIDALGIGAMYDEDVEIRSRCRQCSAPIEITTTDRGRAIALCRPTGAAVWASARYEHGCAANSLCTDIAFFCSDAHLQQWRDQYSRGPGLRLSLDEALEAGRAIFGRSLQFAELQGGKGMSLEVENCSSPTRARKSSREYDLAIVGAGSAGFAAAIRATELGARVALVEHGTLGGTCVNVGCVPSKTLIRAVESVHAARSARRFTGISATAHVGDWPALVAQKDELVSALRHAKYTDLLPEYPAIAFMKGVAHLVPGGISLEGREVSSEKTIIATGTRPAEPNIPGIKEVRYLTSTTALSLERLPKSLLVIGAGYVGAELAQMFARAGVAVTLACRTHLLPEVEPEIGAALTRFFREEGMTVSAGLSYRRLRTTSTGIALDADWNGLPVTLEAEQLLVATGRLSNTEELALEALSVERLPNGGVKVDEYMRTTRAGVYAAGDVTGRDEFVYMAAYGGKIAAENALNGDHRRYDASAMPSVVFTDPQVASVGLTEAQARAQGLAVQTSSIALDQIPRALAAHDTRGLIKLVADRANGRLLGAHILAPEGADSIQTAVLAVKHQLTFRDLADTLFPYLTTVEGLKLAALGFAKDVTKLSCCAG